MQLRDYNWTKVCAFDIQLSKKLTCSLDCEGAVIRRQAFERRRGNSREAEFNIGCASL